MFNNSLGGAAIAKGIEADCKQSHNIRPLAIEGKQGGTWVLIDFGSVLVHIFHQNFRDYYALESLWPGATITTY